MFGVLHHTFKTKYPICVSMLAFYIQEKLLNSFMSITQGMVLKAFMLKSNQEIWWYSHCSLEKYSDFIGLK